MCSLHRLLNIFGELRRFDPSNLKLVKRSVLCFSVCLNPSVELCIYCRPTIPSQHACLSRCLSLRSAGTDCGVYSSLSNATGFWSSVRWSKTTALFSTTVNKTLSQLPIWRDVEIVWGYIFMRTIFIQNCLLVLKNGRKYTLGVLVIKL